MDLEIDNTEQESLNNNDKKENTINVEEINNSYSVLKHKIAKAEKKIEQLEKRANQLEAPYHKYKYIYLNGQEKGNQEQIKMAETELNKIEKQMEEIKAEANEQKEIIIQAKDTIDKNIEMIKNDPQMGKEIDEALLKRYDRQANKLAQEKAELVSKKAGALIFKDMLSNHPSVGNNLRGVLSSISTLNDLESKMQENAYVENGETKYKDYNLKITLNMKNSDAKIRLNKNLDLLYGYCSKNNISKEEVNSYINMIGENGIGIVEETGEIDLEYTLNKSINSLDEKMNKYDERISNYMMLKARKENELGHTLEKKENKAENSINDNGNEDINNGGNKTEIDTKKEDDINIDEDKEENIVTYSPIKWWQFAKRFKNWWIGRKQAKLSASNISQEITEEPKENGEPKEDVEPKEGEKPQEAEKTQVVPQKTKQDSQTLSYLIVREALNRKENEEYEDISNANNVNNANQNKEEKEEER